jgi:hypothetical protein
LSPWPSSRRAVETSSTPWPDSSPWAADIEVLAAASLIRGRDRTPARCEAPVTTHRADPGPNHPPPARKDAEVLSAEEWIKALGQ